VSWCEPSPSSLACPGRDLDDVLPFFTALGFDVTYRQERPNPYAAVRRGGIELHFFSVPEFDPADSMGSVVVLVPNTEALHTAFAAGCGQRSESCRWRAFRG
jgi:hypothetical protein